MKYYAESPIPNELHLSNFGQVSISQQSTIGLVLDCKFVSAYMKIFRLKSARIHEISREPRTKRAQLIRSRNVRC